MSAPLPGPLLLIGSTGLLGQAIRREANRRGRAIVGVGRSEGADLLLDAGNEHALAEVIDRFQPGVVINAAAETSLESCERDPGKAYLANARLPAIAASLCRRAGVRFVQVSTDHYYVGTTNVLHAENEPVRLLNEYARSKYAGETLAMAESECLVVRTNIVGFRGWPGRPTFAEWAIGALRTGEPFPAFDDMWTSSIDVDTFADLLFELINSGVAGVINLAASSALSKLDFIRNLAGRMGLDGSCARPASVHSVSGIPRANVLGLDVGRAQGILGHRLPSPVEVIDTLVNSIQEKT